MKTLYTSIFTIIFLLTGIIANAQSQQRICGHDDVLDQVRSATPGFDEQYDQIFHQARAWADENINARDEDTTYTIQVVFHILYEANDPYQLISDELIHSQLAAMNRDFNKRNADTSETRDVFKPIAGNAKIKFVLAKKNFDQCKDAIIRKQWTAPAAFLPIFMDIFIKDNIPGGSSAWNTEKFLNIWVANLNKSSEAGGGFLGGYAFLPGLVESGLPNRHDGVVIDFRFFGQDNPWVAEVEPGFSLYTKGRTTVHEVGHWLGLRHIWGDLGTLLPEQGCQADDGIDDTPNARQPYSVHGFCQDTIVNSCDEGEGDLPDMFENYMDYSTDECNSMFTHSQADVMRFTLSGYRSGTQLPYDYPVSSRLSAEVNEGESIELSYELEECFGYSETQTSFCGSGATYTSGLGEANLIADAHAFTYAAGDYNPDNVDEFCLVVYDQQHNQYDTTYVDITVNEVMDTVISGIELLSSDKNSIDVFPNPSSGLFTVHLSGKQLETNMRIFNTLGDLVLQQTISEGTRTQSIDMSGYPTGAYVIAFESDDALTFEKMLLK